MQRRGPSPPARPSPRPRSPGDIDGPPRKRQRVFDAQSLQVINMTSGTADVAGPSTSTEVADPMIDTTPNFDDVNMPSESFQDSDPEHIDADFDDRPKVQSSDGGLSALGVKEGEDDANISTVTFNTNHTSGGGTVYNINRDYITHIKFNLMPGFVPPEAMNQIFQHIHASSSTPSHTVAQLPRPSEPPSDQIAKICVAGDPLYNSAIRSIDRVRIMISIVQTMMANPRLCSSEDLPETLASLKRLLTLMELALRAYRHIGIPTWCIASAALFLSGRKTAVDYLTTS
ncbi:hypothetical protein FIBSPDRAFT_466027 [Athelia psychrophila]|uniref:Uncharacterized protein n=1 Tax=Athelia psychrophila TaxID=1759441 RepID=A0A166LJK1_9AGAM|nr:hypothetical protein FIBSPDRAFT_466027 [Fibularhizoctonia sp. CBS 109695]